MRSPGLVSDLCSDRCVARVELGGVSLAYEVVGFGWPLYVCHGGPSTDYQYLRDDLSALAVGVRLVFHDYRGSGESDAAAPETYTFDQLADDLDGLRRELGDERIVVLGHSMGGDVAARVALHHPDAVAGLVLVGASPGTSMISTARAMSLSAFSRAIGRAVVYVARWSWRRETPERRLARYAVWKATFEARPGIQARLDDRAVLRMNDNASELERAGFDEAIWARLVDMKTPILLIYGTRDAAAVAAAGRFKATAAPATEFVVDGGGHHPLFEDKSAVEAVRAFVAERSA